MNLKVFLYCLEKLSRTRISQSLGGLSGTTSITGWKRLIVENVISSGLQLFSLT